MKLTEVRERLDQLAVDGAALKKSKEAIYAFNIAGGSSVTKAYHQDLSYRSLSGVDDPDFKGFYDLYEQTFPLENERESVEGFSDLYKLNDDPDLQQDKGPFKEATLVVHDPQTGKVVGAVELFTAARRPGQDLGGADGFLQMNYVFVQDTHRSMGVGSFLTKAAEEYASGFIKQQLGPELNGREPVMPVFTEQNAPLQMTPDEYKVDTHGAGIDQFDRLKWWQNQGMRRIDMNYVQPALEEGGEACESLTLNVKAPENFKLTPKLMEFYLERFLGISCMKGADISDDQHYKNMLADVQSKPVLATFDDRAGLADLKTKVYEKFEQLDRLDNPALEEDATVGEVLDTNLQPKPVTRQASRLVPC